MQENCFLSYRPINITRPEFRLFLTSAFAVISLPITILNFIIIYTIWKTESLHRPSMTLVLNLALADFFIGIIVCPMAAVGNTLLARRIETWCKFWPAVVEFVFILSSARLCFLTTTSIDRFLAIKLKFSYKSIVTNKRVALVTRLTWLTALITSTFFWVFSLNAEQRYIAEIFGFIVATIILTVIIVFSSMSFHKLRKLTAQINNVSQPSGSQQFDVNKYKRTFYTMLLILFSILSFYVPALFFTVLESIWQNYFLFPYLVRVCQWLIEVNSAVNPLLYLWRIKELREAVKVTFHRSTRTGPEQALGTT